MEYNVHDTYNGAKHNAWNWLHLFSGLCNCFTCMSGEHGLCIYGCEAWIAAEHVGVIGQLFWHTVFGKCWAHWPLAMAAI